MICLSSTRFSMRALLLRPGGVFEDPANPDYDFNDSSQDPYTGEMVTVWNKKVDNPATPSINEGSKQFPCLARGVISNGIRSVGNTEHFGDIYDNLEYVQFWFPSYVDLRKDDRVTEIRDATGRVAYIDEEYRKKPGTGKTYPATVFNVDGVTPVFDVFNHHIENFALLSKVQ